MKRSIFLVVLVGTALLASSSADARGFGRKGDGGGQGPLQNLDQEVIAKIQDLRTEFMKSTVDLRTELYGAEEKFRLTLMDDDASDKDIMDAYKKVQDLKIEFGERRLEHQLKVRKELPEDVRGMLPGMGMHGGMGGRGMGGRGMGDRGMGHGRGMGRGHFGGGFGGCLNNDDAEM